MKVYMGKYPSWIGPYQLAGLLKYVGIHEDKIHKVGERLSKSWIGNMLQWIQSKKKQHVYVHIDKYDTWSMDFTLAHIILPMLKQLKETKHGAPNVDDKDVPKELRSTSTLPKETSWDIDDNHFKRWDWVLNEMIWAFEQQVDEESTGKFYDHSAVDEGSDFNNQISQIKIDYEGIKAHEERLDKAFLLFGKYYRALWD
jgi:hypothetical protein